MDDVEFIDDLLGCGGRCPGGGGPPLPPNDDLLPCGGGLGDGLLLL